MTVIGIVLLIVLMTAAGAFTWFNSRAPAQSSVYVSTSPCSGAQTCLHFPTVTGDNLLGQAFTLPADFRAKNTLVVVPLDEDQQVSAQNWLPLARELASAHPDFAYYDVPMFPSMAAPMRTLIRSGMSLSITDEQLRAVTITVFLDNREQFLSSLKIANATEMQIFLLDRSGQIEWRGAGDYSNPQGMALRAALNL